MVVPFIRAVVNHRLIPPETEVVENVRLAVRQPGRFANVRHHGTYQYYRSLYEATYGLREHGEEYRVPSPAPLGSEPRFGSPRHGPGIG